MSEVAIVAETTEKSKVAAETKVKGASSAFVRTSKILFKPNYTNQIKLDELSNFIDLCSDALNFYVVYFARYHQLDKLLFVHAKHKNNKIFDFGSNLTKLNNIFYDLAHDKEKK